MMIVAGISEKIGWLLAVLTSGNVARRHDLRLGDHTLRLRNHQQSGTYVLEESRSNTGFCRFFFVQGGRAGVYLAGRLTSPNVPCRKPLRITSWWSDIAAATPRPWRPCWPAGTCPCGGCSRA